MPSKISLPSLELLKLMGRSSGWVSILYFLGLLFSIPFEIWMIDSNERFMYQPENVFQYNYDIQLVFLIAVPVLLPLFLFHFMQSKQSSDLIHSLPVKREKIFHQYTISGWVMLNIPVVIIAAIVFLQWSMMDLSVAFSVNKIFIWLGVTVLFNTILYMCTIFIGMITGISIVQGILTYIFLFLPVGLFILVTYNLKYFLYGFPDSYLLGKKIEYLSPLTMLDGMQNSINLPVLLIYGVISVVLYFISKILYAKRKTESVSQAMIFPVLKPVLKFGMTLCCALLAAGYFGEYSNQSEVWLFFGYFFGSFVGYAFAEMLLQKTWRVFQNLKGYLYYGGVLLVVIGFLQLDVTNYEEKVPAIDEIKSVHLSNSPYLYLQPEEFSGIYKPFYLSEKRNIQLVHDLHEKIVSNKKMEDVQSPTSDTAFFVYELKNGKKLVREYIINKEDYTDYYSSIHESVEFKEVTNRIFSLSLEDINMITIEPMGWKSTRAVISNEDDMEEFISILKEEILASTYEEKNVQSAFKSNISFSLNNKEYGGYADLTTLPSYKKLIRWIEEKELTEKAFLTEEDIEYLIVVKKEDIEINRDGYEHLDIFNRMKADKNALTIKNKDQVRDAMAMTKDAYLPESNSTYLVAYKIKSQVEPYVGTMDKKDAPAFINEEF